ncbi:MAG: hypothetical protein H6715_04235 [Myxococcales bacterium]|nr:hypothetical protein [Myxococcales bacterium]
MIAGTMLCAGCKPVSVPGEPVGHFSIVGTLRENTCGQQAVPAKNPLLFEVELRRKDSQAFWIQRGQPAVSGSISPAGHFTFSATSSWVAIAADQSIGYVGCAISQGDTIEGTLLSEQEQDSDAGFSAESWTGTEHLEMTPVMGSNCAPALGSEGGAFSTLPCSVRYDLLGTLLAGTGG